MDSPAYHAAPLPQAPPSPPAPVQGPLHARPAPALAPPRTAPAADDRAHAKRLLRTAAGFYGIVTLFAIGYALFSGTASTLFGEHAAPPGSLLAASIVGLSVVGVCRLGDRMLPVVHRAGDALADLLGPVDRKSAIALAFVSGVAEELLFRGALWPHLGLLGTTFLFGLVHVFLRRDLLVYPLFALGVGLVLGFLREGSGNVLPPMLVHVFVNAVNLWTIAKRPRPAVAATVVPS